MADQETSLIDYGHEGRLNWLVSGAIGGIAGAMAFGAFLGLFTPEIVSVTIPSLYGLEPGGSAGWALHLLHGLVLGGGFGFLVTREPAYRTLITDTDAETGVLAGLGPSRRLTIAGAVYGLAIWLGLLLFVMPIWLSVAGSGAPDFRGALVESLLGHLIFGVTLGFVFANFIKIPSRTD